MSTQRVDPSSVPLPVEAPRARQAPPATPFSQVLSGNHAVVSGTQTNSGLTGGPVFAAPVRDGGGALGAGLGSALGGAVGGAVGGAAGSLIGGGVPGVAGTPGGDINQAHAMQRESQAFNLQLLNLQQEVQDENRRFTTLSNVIKSAHDTAKAAVGNIRS
jgi:hypothetical protein